MHCCCPRVESDKPEEMYDNRKECEIKVLDDEWFFVLGTSEVSDWEKDCHETRTDAYVG